MIERDGGEISQKFEAAKCEVEAIGVEMFS
jgi:hypothetical protein